jgi:mono/diheme cytochrome c family protein
MIHPLNYIAKAICLLIIGYAGFWLLQKVNGVSFIQPDDDKIGWCATESVQGQINLSPSAVNGKAQFMSKCASCHSITKGVVGPALGGFEERGRWADRNVLHEWIKNPEAFMKKDKYTRELKDKYGSMMTAFPAITIEEVNAIADYITQMQYSRSF